VSSAAEIVIAREEHNAFFQFVARGPTERMLDEILENDKCPSQNGDQPHARYQWTWERSAAENPPPWKKTMYWDCLFAGQLYKNGPLSSINIPAPPLLGEAYKLAMQEVANAEWTIKEILKQLEEVIKTAKDPGKKLSELVQNAAKAINKAAQDGGRAAAKAADDVRDTMKKAADDTAKAIDKGAQDAANAAAKAATDATSTAGKAAQDAANAAAKAGTDTAHTAAKAATDTANTAKKSVNDVRNFIRKPF
jgi:hypothetical protein